MRAALLAAAVLSAEACPKSKIVPIEAGKGSGAVQHGLDVSALPRTWDWRNINGTSFVTESLQQHAPQYCGSCWAHGTMSAFSDRIKILRNAAFPDIVVSRQSVLSCYQCGSCEGGDPSCVYQSLVGSSGALPDETCAVYQAVDGVSCTPQCTACWPDTGCGSVQPTLNYTTYYANDYGSISGESDMMSELYARGPIACGIAASTIRGYNGGIYIDTTGDQNVDHIISIVGWGVGADSNGDMTPYWVIRNSWGTAWGESGYMRLQRGTNNLAIESGCVWATAQKTWSF